MVRRPLPRLLLAAACCLFGAKQAAASETAEIQQLLDTSSDYLELVREYWPKISGDAMAMTIVYDALNNCSTFEKEISRANSVDDLDALLAGRHPTDVKFGKAIYYKCKPLLDHLAEFPGWRGLRLRAAQAGDVRSKVLVSLEYYRYRDQRPRESIRFSPAGYLVEALQTRDPFPFKVIGVMGVGYGLRLDDSTTTTVAWQLASCRLSGDCDDPSSMKTYCAFMTPECTAWRTAYEHLRHQAGGDEAFEEAMRKADSILRNVEQQRFDQLDLDLVW